MIEYTCTRHTQRKIFQTVFFRIISIPLVGEIEFFLLVLKELSQAQSSLLVTWLIETKHHYSFPSCKKNSVKIILKGGWENRSK